MTDSNFDILLGKTINHMRYIDEVLSFETNQGIFKCNNVIKIYFGDMYGNILCEIIEIIEISRHTYIIKTLKGNTYVKIEAEEVLLYKE